ncbi:hypothetical protein RIR_jg24777.t1 [Rhizophagus irregularis DAOM 181602=DAOM 197198]|nr:hypothetical protein RIR_jg24777.t1 [Rhizophagus irregularis DAOM 181602=DAOM 197198]
MYFLNDDNINGIRLFWCIFCNNVRVERGRLLARLILVFCEWLGRNSFGSETGTISVDGKIVVPLHIPYSIRKWLRYITHAPGRRMLEEYKIFEVLFSKKEYTGIDAITSPAMDV